jgi:hypothetical protein
MNAPADYLPNQEQHYREAAWNADRSAEVMAAESRQREADRLLVQIERSSDMSERCADELRAEAARLLAA